MAVAETATRRANAGSVDRDAPIDSFVFHEWMSAQQDLAPYLRKGWRELLTSIAPRPLQVLPVYTDPLGRKRDDAYPEQGTIGLEYDTFERQLLDEWAPSRVVLGYDESILVTASANVHAARELIRAINDWTADAWLGRDERLHGLILVSGALSEAAAKEIKRLGRNERMVGVAMGANVLNLTFGHPAYHPIYKAAVEQDLPVVIQVGSDLAATLLTPSVAGGQAAMYGEYLSMNMHPMMSHVAAMIIQGVFEQFPGLKVLLVGGGVTWVPGYLWRLDYAYKFSHQAAPWLRKLPSEYFRESISVSTYQIERSPTPEALQGVLNAAPWMRSNILYASGYPNRDSMSPDEVRERLPAAWHDDVLRDNARTFFRWPSGS